MINLTQAPKMVVNIYKGAELPYNYVYRIEYVPYKTRLCQCAILNQLPYICICVQNKIT